MKKRNSLNIGWLVITLGLVAAIGFGLGPAFAQEANSDGIVTEESADEPALTEEIPVVNVPAEEVGAEFEESFGDKSQATWIGSWQFDPVSSNEVWFTQSNFARWSQILSDGIWYAVVRLPSGDRITQVTWYHYDNDGNNNKLVFWRANSVTSSSSLINIQPNLTGGWWSSTAGTNIRVMNGGGWYVIGIDLPTAGNANHRFWGVRFIWERDQAPAGSQIFTDVGPGNTFYQSINNMYRSGITTGCPSPPGQFNYCPDRAVTRGQMAAFLARALGLYWAYPTY